LLPLWILLDRNRGGAYLAAALAIAGMFGAFLFLTYYLQVVLRYSPLQAGLAFLPLTLASQAGSWGIASVLMPRVPARLIIAPGATAAYRVGTRPSAGVIDQALVHGYATATAWAAGILVVGAVSTFLLVNAGPPRPHPA